MPEQLAMKCREKSGGGMVGPFVQIGGLDLDLTQRGEKNIKKIIFLIFLIK